jgi:hypothetical protein
MVTVAITRPDSPTAVSAIAIDDLSALVTWDAPVVTGGSPILSYTVTSSAGQSCISITTSCTVIGLTGSTNYTFTVEARNAIGTSDASVRSGSITPAAPPANNNNSNNSNNNSNSSNNSGGGYDTSAVVAAAELRAAQEKAAALANIAAQEKVEAELKAAEELKATEIKAAEERAVAEVKAAEEIKAAEIKALADAELAAKLAAKKITPEVSLYSITPKLTLSTYDLAYLKKYLSTLKKTATVTCIGYTYTQKLSLAKATVLAKKQATAVCAIVKKTRPTLKTAILIRPAKSAPKAAAGAQWVAISYRVDGYQLKK